MFKKFIGITSMAVVTALSTSPAFADNKAQNIIDSPSFSEFFQIYQEDMVGNKPISLKNNIFTDDLSNIVYSFAQGDTLKVDSEVLETNAISAGHKDFIKSVANTYNNAYSKGYYKTNAQVSVYLTNSVSYNFYSAPELKKQFDEHKEIISHNEVIHKQLDELNSKFNESYKNIELLDDVEYEKITNSSEYISRLDEIIALSSTLKKIPVKLGSREFLNIEKNQELFDSNVNPSQIFVLGNTSAGSEHKNFMRSKPNVIDGMEQCYSVVSIDRNGDKINLLPDPIDKSAMMFSNTAEKVIFQKFILLHELAHCDFGINETTPFKKFSLGDPNVDKIVNDLFNPANQSRYTNVFTRHFQEHYADVYASMVLMREESDKKLVSSVLDNITKLRAIGSTQGDYEHLSTYSLQQLSHPEIAQKILTMPIEELSSFAFSISERGVALTLAHSKDFQNYLNENLSKIFLSGTLNALVAATEGVDYNQKNYLDKGLGSGNSTTLQYENNLTNELHSIFQKQPHIKSEMKVFLASTLKTLQRFNLTIPSEIKNFDSSNDTVAVKQDIFSAPLIASDKYIKIHGDFHILGNKLKESLVDKPYADTTMTVSMLHGIDGKSIDSSPSKLPSNINSFILKTALDKETLKKQVEEVSKQAIENRNTYLNTAKNIKINKIN